VPNERRGSDTLNKLLDVAERAFAVDGYAGAHLQQMADHVGVKKAAVYYYFPSKAALHEAVLVRVLEALDATVAAALSRPGTPEQRLEALLSALNELMAVQQNYSQILIRLFIDRPEADFNHLLPLVERPILRLLEFYREGYDQGVFVKMSSRHLVQTMLGAIVFHYGSKQLGTRMLGVDDLFSRASVEWRDKEVRRFALNAILRRRPVDLE